MAWKPMFHFGADEVVGNSQVFATKEEAEASARNRFMRWTLPTDWSVVETDEPHNYAWDDVLGDVSLAAMGASIRKTLEEE